MSQRIMVGFVALILGLSLLTFPANAAQSAESQEDAGYYAGSFLFSIIFLPLKVVSCAATGIAAGTAYIATYGVPGNYDGGTNGRDVAEVSRGMCSTPWVVTHEQVKKDYQP